MNKFKFMNFNIEKIISLIIFINIIFIIALLYLLTDTNSELYAEFSNNSHGGASIIIGFFIFLITKSFKTILLLKWGIKYDSIPKVKKDEIFRKSKSLIFISIIFLLLILLTILIFPTINDGYFTIAAFTSIGIFIGLYFDSYWLDNAMKDNSLLERESDNKINLKDKTI